MNQVITKHVLYFLLWKVLNMILDFFHVFFFMIQQNNKIKKIINKNKNKKNIQNNKVNEIDPY